MARKPGLPAKYAKMGFKKGWREYKKARGMRGAARPATRAAPRPATSRPKTKVVYRQQPRKPAAPKTMGRPMVRLLPKKTMETLINSVMVGLTALGSTFAVQKTPYVKDLNSYFKAAIQATIGLLLFPMFKQQWVKSVGGGMVTGAAISLAIPYMPEGFTFGAGRNFTSDELAELQTVGKPYKITNQPNVQQMGYPVKVGRSSPLMGHGKMTYSRGRRNYAAY